MYPDQYVNVQGFPWCRDAPNEVRIETLTQQMLCKKHNEQLGKEVDWASKHSLDTLGRAFELYNAAEYQSCNWKVQYLNRHALVRAVVPENAHQHEPSRRMEVSRRFRT